MRVGIGGHLWPHALSWHEVALAIACQFPLTPGFPIHPLPFNGPSYLAPLFFNLPLQNLLSSSCPRMMSIARGKKRNSVMSSGAKLKACGHVLFSIKMELIVDTSRGEMSLNLCCWFIYNGQKSTNSVSNAVKIRACGVLLGPKGTVRELSLD